MKKISTYYHGFLIALLFLFFSVAKVFAQTMSLENILNAVETNNPELKIYDSQVNAYNEYAKGAKALEPPQVGAGFFMTPYNVGMWKSDAMTGSQGMGSFMISAQQMFTNAKKLNSNAGFMQSMANVDKEMKNAMRNELFAMAKMNYYEWLVLRKKLAVINESEELLSYIIKSSEIRYTYGMDKLSAYYKAKAMLGDIQNMRLMIEYEIQQKRIALNTLMNQNKEQGFDIDTLVTIKNYDSLLVDTAMLSANRSDFKALDKNISLLKAKQTFEKSKLLPDFGVKYDHMLAFGTQPQQFSLMGMMTIPIAPWSAKMQKASVAGLYFDMEAVKRKQEVLLNNASGNLWSIKEQVKTKKLQMELYRKTIISSMKKNYETSLLAYEQNNEELFMVLDAWQNLKLAQLSYLDILNDLLQLQVKYEKETELK